jgi:hypothetical protein
MTTKHTPTPWTLEWECEDTGILKDANGEHITHINGSRYFDDRQDEIAHENAAFIVRACNSHDELVKVLGDAVRRLESLDKYIFKITGQQPEETALGEVTRGKQALAKAKGEA